MPGADHASSRIASLTRSSWVWSSFIRSNSACASSRRSRRSRRFSSSSLPVRSSSPSRAARASSSARSARDRSSARRRRQVGAEAAMELGIEVLGRDLREELDEPRMRDARSERVPLEPLALLEQLRRELLGERPDAALRRQPGERLLRQAQPAGEQPQRVLPLGRVLVPLQDLADPHERLLAVGRAVELEPHAVDDVALRPAEPRLEPGGASAGSWPFGSVTTRTSNPSEVASSIPRKRRLLPGRVGVEAEVEPAREPLQLLQLALGQRRAHRGDDRLEPGLAQRDHVRVPLDDDARAPASRSPSAPGAGRRGSPTCGRARPRAS